MNTPLVAVDRIVEPSDRRNPWIVHINTSANGGGVAELLRSLVTSVGAERRDIGWMVVRGGPEYYAFTKSVHHLLHGRGTPYRWMATVESSEAYRATLDGALPEILDLLRPGDVAVLHDPQTLGLARGLARHGIRVAWHCHIGSLTDPSGVKSPVWRYFSEDLQAVERVFTTRREYLAGAPEVVVHQVAPAISGSSPKNSPLTTDQIAAYLADLGLGSSATPDTEICRRWQTQPIPDSALVVLQVARWDPLKRVDALLRCAERFDRDTHLVVAGPDPRDVVDDPEGRAELDAVLEVFRTLPGETRARTHVVCLSNPGSDSDVTAHYINALQRRADVVVQYSVEEGFGLAVTEAMYKSKPVVAARVGGLPAQVLDGVTGLLVDPSDDDGLAAAVNRLGRDPRLRAELGGEGRRLVTGNYLIERLVSDYDRALH